MPNVFLIKLLTSADRFAFPQSAGRGRNSDIKRIYVYIYIYTWINTHVMGSRTAHHRAWLGFDPDEYKLRTEQTSFRDVCQLPEAEDDGSWRFSEWGMTTLLSV